VPSRLAAVFAACLTACAELPPLESLRLIDVYPLTSSPNGSAWDLARHGDVLWVRDSYGAAAFQLGGARPEFLRRVDVEPRSPQGTSFLAFNGSLVVVGHGQRAVVFDATTGEQLSSIPSASTGTGQLVLDGTTLYAAMLEAGVRRFDLSDPRNPGGFETLWPGYAHTLLLEGDRLYASGESTLVILDVKTPKTLGEVRLPFQGALLLHAGRWLYGNTGEGGPAVVDVADPAAPVVLTPGGSTRFTKGALAFRGNRLLVPSRTGPTYEYALDEPGTPRLVKEHLLVPDARASNWDALAVGDQLLLAHETGLVTLGP
jgi:hypothetical protein